MGFHEFSSPYDWSRIASYKRTAKAAFGGMVDLSVGSPVDPVPDSVRKALAVSSNDPNAYGYPVTAGTADLRDAIHEWFAAARNVDLRAIGADAVPTVGSKEGVALMASLLHFGEGDVVVQPKVSYPTYEIGTQLAGAQTLKVDDVADADSWKDVPGVKAVWVNSPCNPTGEVLSAEQMAGIVRVARAIGAVVLSDECYALMQWEDDVAEVDADTLASTAVRLARRCVWRVRRRRIGAVLAEQAKQHGRVSYGAYRWRSIADRADGGIPQTDRADHSRTGAGCDGRRAA